MSGVIKFSWFDVSKVIFIDLRDNSRISSQKIGYVRYGSGSDSIPLKIQTPVFEYDIYGIPRENQYYPTTKSRTFFKLGFTDDKRENPDINYDDIQKFKEILISIDKICDTDKFRKAKFGEKNYNKYVYQPLVRTPESDDKNDDDNSGTNRYKPQYTKIKLNMKYHSEDIPDFDIYERKDNTREKINIQSFDDVLKHIKFKSELRFIINFSKMYAMKTAIGNDKKSYGIILKAQAIEVRPNPNHTTEAENVIDAFDDGDALTLPKLGRTITRIDINDE